MTLNLKSPAANASVELHIEHLVLDGFEHLDCDGIGRAVRQELSRLLMQGSVPDSLARHQNIAQFDGGSITLARNAGAAAVGAQIAGSVYKGFER